MIAPAASLRPALRYRIAPLDPHAHLFMVTCTISDPDPAGQTFFLPTWIPGSYMLRDFAKNVVALHAESAGRSVAVTQLSQSRWQAAPVAGELTLSWQIYAWDLSVRTAHLDASHAFFNGTSVFPCIEGKEDRPCLVDIQAPDDYHAGGNAATWRVATTLRPADGFPQAAAPWGFGLYWADNYDELVDHPVEMGNFSLLQFTAAGVPHAVAITGQHDADLVRLGEDLQRICEWQIAFFGNSPPMSKYLFLITVVGDGYGGLEHRASTALLCSRYDLPTANTPRDNLPDGYLSLLGLCSHEYFHTWNVKRIKPAAFIPYDLQQGNPTRLLWAFEGFTSYYDDLCLRRSGLISGEQYLNVLAKTLSQVQKTPGQQVQSLVDSSFTAWTKYYQQNENTPNAVVSYYTKGAVVALALDVQLRTASQGARSLDDVMLALWERHGKTGQGVAEDGLYALVSEIGGAQLGAWLQHAVETTGEIPLVEPLAAIGVDLTWMSSSSNHNAWLGVRTSNEGNEVKVTHVFNHSPAHHAGIAAGDVLVAWNGLRITPSSFDKLLQRHLTGETVQLYLFRRDELQQLPLMPGPAPLDMARLQAHNEASGTVQSLRQGWLGG